MLGARTKGQDFNQIFYQPTETIITALTVSKLKVEKEFLSLMKKISTVVPLYSYPLYKHNLYIFTLVLGPVFYIVKCPLYCHKLIIVTITVIHGPNIIITYENFPIYSHISLLRKYIMSFESKILSFAVVSRSAPILIWK